MSTDYTLTLTSSDGTTGNITVIDSLNPLPGSDSWKPADPAQWGDAGGPVSSWASGGLYLTGPVGAMSVFLENFGKGTEPGDAGTGQKNYDDGSFPMGNLTWRCTGKD